MKNGRKGVRIIIRTSEKRKKVRNDAKASRGDCNLPDCNLPDCNL